MRAGQTRLQTVAGRVHVMLRNTLRGAGGLGRLDAIVYLEGHAHVLLCKGSRGNTIGRTPGTGSTRSRAVRPNTAMLRMRDGRFEVVVPFCPL